MPSLNSLLALTVLALVPFTSAIPVAARPACPRPKTTATLPSTGGPTELPASTLPLAFVAIGRGVQNYTCSAVGAAPVAIGAIATLFDATKLANSNEDILHQIPPLAVYQPIPKSLPSTGGPLSVLGHHYFDAAGTPVFDLNNAGKQSILFSAKQASVKAPATANKGPAGTGAVDWLFLSSKAGYTSVGLSQVYRVVTAGGVGPTCTQTGVTSVEYATEYWFY